MERFPTLGNDVSLSKDKEIFQMILTFKQKAMLDRGVQQDYINWVVKRFDNRKDCLPTLEDWVGYTLDSKECPNLFAFMKKEMGMVNNDTPKPNKSEHVYVVYENDQFARWPMIKNCPKDWTCNVFYTFQEAQKYANYWMGSENYPVEMELNEPVPYAGKNVIIKKEKRAKQHGWRIGLHWIK